MKFTLGFLSIITLASALPQDSKLEKRDAYDAAGNLIYSGGEALFWKFMNDRTFCYGHDNMIWYQTTKDCCWETFKGASMVHFNELMHNCSWGNSNMQKCCASKGANYCKGECPDLQKMV
ncbi:hypothetical protein K502DRAFT_332722 [Neoconidiobolus thromboides FSU 785]|nr:hypothetical protein K502DRAFT_332722 [Neoconidiobolus thromboides FSU 785]